MKFLAVTACPSGVAHTYMAAEAIQQACEKAGVECKVETQGSIGIENQITTGRCSNQQMLLFLQQICLLRTLKDLTTLRK